jgi:hypothetical protein
MPGRRRLGGDFVELRQLGRRVCNRRLRRKSRQMRHHRRRSRYSVVIEVMI